jgi:hypothetical protein
MGEDNAITMGNEDGRKNDYNSDHYDGLYHPIVELFTGMSYLFNNISLAQAGT